MSARIPLHHRLIFTCVDGHETHLHCPITTLLTCMLGCGWTKDLCISPGLGPIFITKDKSCTRVSYWTIGIQAGIGDLGCVIPTILPTIIHSQQFAEEIFPLPAPFPFFADRIFLQSFHLVCYYHP